MRTIKPQEVWVWWGVDRFLTECKQGFNRWVRGICESLEFSLFWKISEDYDEEWNRFLENWWRGMDRFLTESKQGFIRWFFLENIVLFRLFFNFVYFYLEIVEEDDEEWIMVDFFTESKQGFIRWVRERISRVASTSHYLSYSDCWAVLCIFSDLWFPQSLTFKLSSCFLNLSDFRYQTAELFSVSILLPFTIFKGINVSTLVCKKGL